VSLAASTVVEAARVSNLAVDAAAIAWAISLVAFAADAAFGGRSSARSAALVGGAVVRVPAGSHPSPAGDGDGPSHPGSSTGRGAAATSAGHAFGPSRAARIGWSVFVLGTVLLAVAVVARGVAAGRVPWGNMYEFAITGALVSAVVLLVVRRRFDVAALAVWVNATLLLTLGLAITVLYVPAGPLVPALQSPWLVVHVAAAIVAAAVFTVSMVASALFVVRDRAERRGSTGRYVARLPSAAALDRLAYRTVAFAFPIWSFAIVAGAIWAQYSWGRYWGWDPKEVWSFISWVCYAAYLHARTTAGWRGRRAAVVNLVAYATMLFNFFGVNIVFEGLHSYGGL